MFIDKAQVYIKAGNGGNGCMSFRREKFVPKGGPDGGSGGRGGDVIFEADGKLQNLNDFKYNAHFVSEKGGHGSSGNKKGRNGKARIIRVPKGTVLTDMDTGEILSDLLDSESSIIAAVGGRGGRGNTSYKRSSGKTLYDFEKGYPGEEKRIGLELKIIADAGLIGCPNAGKSTLISRLSKAKPKVADYPFTTIRPYLGIVEYEQFKTFIIADIPGLVKGAHSGKGLGDEFLRHVKRTKVLVYLVDLSGSFYEDYVAVREELRLYDADLMQKPYVVAGNKMDLQGSEENFDDLVGKLKKDGDNHNGIFAVSALRETGLNELAEGIGKMVEENML